MIVADVRQSDQHPLRSSLVVNPEVGPGMRVTAPVAGVFTMRPMINALGIHIISTAVLGDRRDIHPSRSDGWVPIFGCTFRLTTCGSDPGDCSVTSEDLLVGWVRVSFVFPTPKHFCTLGGWVRIGQSEDW